MESAISQIPYGLSIANLANTIKPQPTFKSGNMAQSKGILKSQDHPLFKPVNMKTAPKEIVFKPINLNMPNKLIRPVAMVKPNKREESLSKADGKDGKEPKSRFQDGVAKGDIGAKNEMQRAIFLGSRNPIFGLPRHRYRAWGPNK